MLTWSYVAGGRGLELVGTGVVLATELLEVNRQLLEEKARLRSVRHALVSFDAAEGLEVSTPQIRRIVEQDHLLAAWLPNLSIAVVANKDVQFGISRIWEALADTVGWRIGVFRSRLQAEQWLRGPTELEL